MKRILLFAITALLVGGCSQFQEEESRPQISVVAPATLEAKIESLDSDSRTYIESDNTIRWVAGDEISYFPGVASNVRYRFAGETGSRYGSFEKQNAESATGAALACNYGVYPYAESISIATDGTISLTLPAKQNYAVGSFGTGANVMIAATANTEDTAPRFKNLGGMIKFQLYGTNAKVKSLTLKGNNCEPLAGEASVTAKHDQAPKLTLSDTASTTLTLDCSAEGGVTLSSNASTPTEFWITVPETTFTEGFTLTVEGAEGGTFTKSTSKSLTIERNTIQPMAPIEVKLAGEGIDIVENKVRFFLEERSDGTRRVTNIAARDWSTSTISVNSAIYPIEFTADKRPYVDVEFSEDNSYTALLQTPSSSSRYGTNAYTNLKLPHSQFHNTVESIISAFPMYAQYAPANGNKLIFNDGFAIVHLRMKGSAKIASVRIENPEQNNIAGLSSANTTTGRFTVSKGVDFAALNCTNQGSFVQLNTSTATDFYVMLAPGTYASGLNLSVCDSEHLAVLQTIPALTLEEGDVYHIDMTYSPDSSLLYYEGFDNFVWGGDYMKGSSKGKGLSPDGSTISYTSGLTRTGYEEAFSQVNYNNPGTGFIQSNTWADVSNQTVALSHQMPDSYITSRNIGDYQYMFRAQEHPGYIAIGATTTGRGMFRLPLLSKQKSIATVKVSFKFSIQPGYVSDGTLETNIIYGGYIASAKLNGVALSEELTSYSSETAKTIIPRSQLLIPTNATVAKEWNTIELVVEGATNGTILNITDTSLTSGKHGIYLDSIEIREIENSWAKSPTTLRVLMWNIQNGMWCDQPNNYNNFVEWVKKWDADICIWCESETIYKDNTSTNQTESKRYLPNGWSALCKRYGHSYAYTGGNRDNYSQTVTSKFPISNVLRITNSNVSGKPITHGAGHCTVTFNGKKVNIVACHMWPQQYAYGVSGSDKQTESANNLEGDYYREFEMQYIVSQTVNKSSNSNETLWLLGGDTNSRSPKDEWFYNPNTIGPTKYLPHKYILENTNLKDVIADRFPAGRYFMTSTYASNRIDILYASPEMFNRITCSTMLFDAWAHNLPVSEYVSGFHTPSDHRPVIVDFDMK